MKSKKKVPTLNKVAYGIGTGGGCIFNQIAAAFLLLGAILIIVGFAITGLAGENTTMIVVGTIIRSLGVGPILSAVFALIPDVVEYGNWKFGIRSEGLISSAQSIGSKIGIGVGSALTG